MSRLSEGEGSVEPDYDRDYIRRPFYFILFSSAGGYVSSHAGSRLLHLFFLWMMVLLCGAREVRVLNIIAPSKKKEHMVTPSVIELWHCVLDD